MFIKYNNFWVNIWEYEWPSVQQHSSYLLLQVTLASSPCSLCSPFRHCPLWTPLFFHLLDCRDKSVVSSFHDLATTCPPHIWFPKHVSSLNQQHRIPQRMSADACADHCLFWPLSQSSLTSSVAKLPFSPRALLALEPPPLNQKPRTGTTLVWFEVVFVNGHWENSVSGGHVCTGCQTTLRTSFQHMTQLPTE